MKYKITIHKEKLTDKDAETRYCDWESAYEQIVDEETNKDDGLNLVVRVIKAVNFPSP